MNDSNLVDRIRNGGGSFRREPDITSKIQNIGTIIQAKRRKLQNQFILRTVILNSILLVILMSVSTMRAALIDFIQIGVVRIFQLQSHPTQDISNQDAQKIQK